MGTTKRFQVDNLFDSLLKLLKNQQEQLKTLVQERKFLEDRIKAQHKQWLSDIRLYEDHITQMKEALVEKDMTCLLEASKSDLMIGLKHREASFHKLKLEQTEDDLADFKACFDYLSHILEKNSKETDNGQEEGRHGDLKSAGSKRLDNEVKRLKFEYEKLASEKNSEISALLKEKSFVWNQYNVLESNLTDKLKNSQVEIDQANEKIAKVLASVELLHSSNSEKDEMIGSLKVKLAEVEADRNKWREKSSQLSQELDSLRKSKSAQVVSAPKNGSTRAKALSQGVKSSGRKGSNNIVVKKELSPGKAGHSLKDIAKGSRSLKRKADEAVIILETPRLFSSAFKIPKLKQGTLSTPVL
ncbi:hypothetical protein P3X46_002023 [Hevea brasiliensis]|uniref:Uncharacterized protein n=2 Tax=Hevea brasiliensis TaxID=3981 RepID=A0ABQ9N1L7_HEVBR|nr:uncharacterized protein LOC110673819 [Hevea brasiliensis]KAF2324692.1 hypothetical protein GH714_016314 [Hevea brasiliensis]KAJ9186451.1 hypothetical protein P3X46_002023 [Hevea brasiliensis]